MSKGKIPHSRRRTSTLCLHCGSTCQIQTGDKVYKSPHSRSRFAMHKFHVCPSCSDSYVGCHEGTDIPLGFAANRETRMARSRLHDQMLDPLWADAPNRKEGRANVYRFLTYVMDLHEAAHIGDFSIEQCREAWRILSKETYRSIAKFIELMKKEEAENA